MLALAATISEPFDYVRVDLYDLVDRIIIGELTFTPANGLNPRMEKLALGNHWNVDDQHAPSNHKR